MIKASEARQLLPKKDSVNLVELMNKISDLIQTKSKLGFVKMNLCDLFDKKTFFSIEQRPYNVKIGQEFDTFFVLSSVGNSVYNELIDNGYTVEVDVHSWGGGPSFIVKW